MNTVKILAKGSLIRMIQFFLNALTGLILMPFIVRSLGDNMYGLWILIGSFLGYYGMLDLGITSSVHRYVSRAIGKKDYEEANIITNTVFFMFILLGLIILLVSLLFSYFGPILIKNITEVYVFRIIMLILALNIAIGFPMRVFIGVLNANLRYDLKTTVELVRLILRTVLIVFFLKKGYGIIALAFITFFADLFNSLFSFFLVRKYYKYIIISRKFFKVSRVKHLFKYSIYSFVSRIADELRFNVDNLVIVSFLSLSMVTVYSVGARLIKYFMDFMTATVGILVPVFSQFEGRGDYEGIKRNLFLTTKLCVYVSIFIAGNLIIFGKPFIIRWMGHDYVAAYSILLVLIFSATISQIQSPASQMLYGISKHKFLAQINLFEGIVNLALSIVLVKKLGIIGVAVGTAIPMAIFKGIILPYHICNILKVSFKEFYMHTILLLIAKISIFFIVFYVLFNGVIKADYFSLLTNLAIELVFFSGYLFVILGKDEKNLIKRIFVK